MMPMTNRCRHTSTPAQIMKIQTRPVSRQAFTLVEMLVVIAIIATLAGLLLPVVSSVKRKAKIAQAGAEVRSLAAAIAAYQSIYAIFPCSDADAKGGNDMTYTTNSDIITILLDMDAGVNAGHVRNPQKHVFLNGKMVSTVVQPGIGPDYNFRDPWGQPYVITLDLNYDNRCHDSFYFPKVGEIPNAVMVWSYGPDGKPFGPSGDAKARDNDDVKSW
jgi:prepilin-type N-terminal cleavage/methylation domain-containing protein